MPRPEVWASHRGSILERMAEAFRAQARIEIAPFQPLIAGAGGGWPVFAERPDSDTVLQQDPLGCGPACAQMLLRGRGITDIDQEQIASMSGIPVDVRQLADALNQLTQDLKGRWVGGSFVEELSQMQRVLQSLVKRGSFMAELKQYGNIAHLVVIDGFDEQGRVRVRDPWEATSYTMEMSDFLDFWTTRALFFEMIP